MSDGEDFEKYWSSLPSDQIDDQLSLVMPVGEAKRWSKEVAFAAFECGRATQPAKVESGEVEHPWDTDVFCEENGVDIKDDPLYMALCAVGVYPKESHGGENSYTKRSDFMEGWNTAVMTITRNQEQIKRAITSAPTPNNEVLLGEYEAVEIMAKADVGAFGRKLARWDYPVRLIRMRAIYHALRAAMQAKKGK